VTAVTSRAIALAAAAAAASAGVTAPTELRYDLREGDRLVYRQVLERTTHGEREVQTRLEWRTHVLVLGPERGLAVVAVERNRVSAELLRAGGLSGERLEAERREFSANLPPARLAEANLVDERGGARLPWSALREASSELLPGLHELELLPAEAVAPGDSWERAGVEQRATAVEEIEGRRCLRIESDRAEFRLRAWFDIEARQLARLEIENEYARGSRQIRERLTLEAVERTRGEELSAWLAAPETREAALAGLVLQSSRPIAATILYALLDPAEPAVSRRALALAYRRSLAPPQGGALDQALESADPRVRVLATRLAALLPPATAAPIRARAAQDADPFVREAAAQGSGQPAGVAGGCGVPAHEPHAEVPGATLRAMTAAGFEGWPYVIYVPEDYRGDQPFPLLIYMSGGEGRAMIGVAGARQAMERSGYIVLMPQASDFWWTPRSLEIVSALLEETLRRMRVDTDRVYASGFSNGGTGTYHVATLLRDRFAAAVSLEGAGTSVALDAGPASNLHDLPFLFVHGDRDEVVPAGASDRTVKAIRRARPDAPVALRILPGRGHDLTLGTDEGLTLRFLEGKRRDPFPRRVRFGWRDLRQPRSFWIEVLDKDFGTAEVEAEIGPDNTIRLRTENIGRLRLLLRRELLPSPEALLRVVWNDRTAFEGPFAEDCALFARTAAAIADPQRAWSMELTLDRPR
jgi:hypothetical protein